MHLTAKEGYFVILQSSMFRPVVRNIVCIPGSFTDVLQYFHRDFASIFSQSKFAFSIDNDAIHSFQCAVPKSKEAVIDAHLRIAVSGQTPFKLTDLYLEYTPIAQSNNYLVCATNRGQYLERLYKIKQTIPNIAALVPEYIAYNNASTYSNKRHSIALNAENQQSVTLIQQYISSQFQPTNIWQKIASKAVDSDKLLDQNLYPLTVALGLALQVFNDRY